MNSPPLARVEFYHFTVFGLDSGQRANEVAMRDDCCGLNLFALEKLGKRVCSILQSLMGLN